jgi:hypothetical protein
VALTLCSDVSAGEWVSVSELGWWKLVTLGPAGFGGYARLRFLPDPAYEGQRESEADVDAAPCATEQWRVLFELLGPQTGTPEDCYFCLWDGWPDLRQVMVRQPKLNVPHDDPFPKRRYFLLRGSLSAAADGGITQLWPDGVPGYEPAFVWPADHAWCVTNDVDPHWAGIGASGPVIEQLVADKRLDAVLADHADDQPFYR